MGTLIAGLGFVVVAFALAPWGVEAATWVPIKGNVRLANGTPVCAMVLANGQYMFSCDGTGAFNLNVPLDDQGQITLFAFADGFAPYRVTAGPRGLPRWCARTAVPGSALVSTTRELACAANGWVRISGEVESFGGAPLCAMVLANGQQCSPAGKPRPLRPYRSSRRERAHHPLRLRRWVPALQRDLYRSRVR